MIGGYLNALTALSSSLSGRADGGRDPRALHRTDIVGFLTRLAQQESTGQISARVRIRTVRNVRQVLRDARDIGLTREGGPAAGLPGDFAVRADDVPRQPAADPSVRALPAAVMRQLDAGLDELDRRVLVEFRVAVELLMDTGRRPDEICQLPIDCLERDGDGKYVLVYDDFKENRRLRRLPIPDSTAALIRRQQERVRQRFPQTRREQLVLLPTSVRNPHGTRSIRSRVLTNVHREWVNGLPELLLDDGAPYPKHQVVPYAYRHSYAQRHADAGTAVDVLAELLGHELLHSTQRYYNSRELHRTGEKALVAR